MSQDFCDSRRTLISYLCKNAESSMASTQRSDVQWTQKVGAVLRTKSMRILLHHGHPVEAAGKMLERHSWHADVHFGLTWTWADP